MAMKAMEKPTMQLPLDPAIDEELKDYMARRKAESGPAP